MSHSKSFSSSIVYNDYVGCVTGSIKYMHEIIKLGRYWNAKFKQKWLNFISLKHNNIYSVSWIRSFNSINRNLIAAYEALISLCLLHELEEAEKKSHYCIAQIIMNKEYFYWNKAKTTLLISSRTNLPAVRSSLAFGVK